MGVPSFYRWLVNKYPKIVVKAIEEHKTEDLDTSLPNPNGLEFHNLYLDMNGIIHPCFHPHDTDNQPISFDEVFDGIFEYIDGIFAIVRPRNLLYLAIDGVAPRAKMNQQRSRRFRNAKDNALAEAEEERLRLEFLREGKPVLPSQESPLLDSNIITPGTEFMFKLSKALAKYICARLESDPGWINIKVILSDANVPGEGEHKIMSFIRQQRSHADYNPNTRHCLYGLDADLIMLALATHELHFSILREDLLYVEATPSTSEAGLAASLTTVDTSSKSRGGTNNRIASIDKKHYQFVHIWILREYLELDMKKIEPPEQVQIDVERLIDDFIFICFFAGNDFLPRMPTLLIHEGAIDLLMYVYKKEFKSMGGYMVDMQQSSDKKLGFIKLKRVEKFTASVGKYEEKIFQKRSGLHQRSVRRILCDNADEEGDLTPRSHEPGTISKDCLSNQTETSDNDPAKIVENTKQLQEKLKTWLRQKDDLLKNGFLGNDRIRLGTAGWKERYFKEKFSAGSPEEIENIRQKIVEKYTEGLIWILLYYYSGVQSWSWYYPFHYAPFASDLKGLAHGKIKFEKGVPFKPFDQLMGTLPPRSAHALPESYQGLMMDEKSSIIDFYPTDFDTDTDGVRFIWQGINKLSFIDESRLLGETRKLEKDLTQEDAIRNSVSEAQLFVGSSTKLGVHFVEIIQKKDPSTKHGTVVINTTLSDGFSGLICPFSEDLNIVDSTSNFQEIKRENVLCVFYECHPNSCAHIQRILAGVVYPDKTISEEEIMETLLWHDNNGNRESRLYSRGWHGKESRSGKSATPNSCEVDDKRSFSGWVGRGKAVPGNLTGIENMRILESGERIASYGRSRPMNNSRPTDDLRKSDDGLASRQSLDKRSFSGWVGRGKAVPGNWTGIENMRILESGERSASYGTSRPMNNSRPTDLQKSDDVLASRQGRGRAGFHDEAMNYSRQNNSQQLYRRGQFSARGRGTCSQRGTQNNSDTGRKDRW